MLADKDAQQRETITKWPIWLALTYRVNMVNVLCRIPLEVYRKSGRANTHIIMAEAIGTGASNMEEDLEEYTGGQCSEGKLWLKCVR